VHSGIGGPCHRDGVGQVAESLEHLLIGAASMTCFAGSRSDQLAHELVA
jgi:hypothetical protein